MKFYFFFLRLTSYVKMHYKYLQFIDESTSLASFRLFCYSEGIHSQKRPHLHICIQACVFIKFGLSPSKKMDVSCSIENPLIMMKNAFYFILKSLFVLKIFKFLSRLFGHVGNSLIRKIRLTSKFMTSLLGLQTIAIHIFPNISQSKGNQTMKFGELIKYNKRNIFL